MIIKYKKQEGQGRKWLWSITW